MAPLRVSISHFSSLCYACMKVKETEMVVPCIASVNSHGDSRKKAFKLPSKTDQVHLLVLGLVQTHVFVERNMAVFLQAVIICTIT